MNLAGVVAPIDQGAHRLAGQCRIAANLLRIVPLTSRFRKPASGRTASTVSPGRGRERMIDWNDKNYWNDKN